jgi:hypothetical protein
MRTLSLKTARRVDQMPVLPQRAPGLKLSSVMQRRNQ